jgi:Helix-turn-helix domain
MIVTEILGTSQPERVLWWLRRGPVRPLQMWVEEGIYRVADPVEKLRKKGYVIGTSMVAYTNSKGRRMEFAEYRLIREP